MRSRSSTDRLEALSIEIERKLQKVPYRPRPLPKSEPPRGVLAAAISCGVRFSCPGLLGLLNFSSNLCSSRAIEA